MRPPPVATAALSLLIAACGPAEHDAPRPPDPTAAQPVAPSTTTPGDGPDPSRLAADPAPYANTAAQVAASFAIAAYTTRGEAAARVAPYVTDRLLAEFSSPAASPSRGPQLDTVTAVVEAVNPVARWRFEIVLTVTEQTSIGPVLRSVLLVIDVADTPVGPRVGAVR
jgi:hypothetical protein